MNIIEVIIVTEEVWMTVILKLPNWFSSLKELFAMSRNAYLNSSLYLSDIMQWVIDNQINFY